jgi:hypothetical protein
MAAWCVVLVMLFGGGRVAGQTPVLSEQASDVHVCFGVVGAAVDVGRVFEE